MKKTGLVITSIIGVMLLLGIFGYSLVAAEQESDDESDDSESSSQIEIEVKISNDATTRVEAHYNGAEDKFTLSTSDISEIISEIADRTGLTEEQVQANLHLETEDDDEQESELEEDDDSDDSWSYGAEVRLTRLQDRLERRISMENNAIDVVQDVTDPDADVSDLQATVSDTQDVLADVNTAIDELPTTSKQDAANAFVSLKEQAINLFQQFRQQFRELLDNLTNQERQQIRQELRSSD